MNDARAQARSLNLLFIFTFVFVFLNTMAAFAGPSRTTYQARIVKPDGYPLEGTNINFKFTILDTSGSCILYSETYSAVNMGSSGGLVSFSLGTGVRTFPVSGSTFEQVFSNTTASLTCDAGGPATYSPSANDTRKIVMQFNDGAGWQTLPAMTINAVPYAMYANDSLKFNGKDITDFVQVASLPTCAASEAVRFNGAGFSCVAVGGGSATVTSGSVVTALGYTPADDASVTALGSSLSTANSNISNVSSTVTSVSSTVYSVSSTVTSLQNSVAASFAAITSSQWATSGTKIFYNSGNVGIGVSDPLAKLHVADNVATNIILEGSLNNTAAPGFVTRKSRGTIASPTAVLTDDYIGTFGARGYGATGYSTTSRGLIGIKASQDWTDSAQGASIVFETTPVSGTTRSEKMRIDASGNVGIGTSNPTSLLQIGAVSAFAVDTNSNLSLNGAPFPTAPLNRGIFFSYLQDSAGVFAGKIGFSTPAGVPGLTLYNNQGATRTDVRLLTQSGGLAFGTNATSAAPSVQMVLTASGNVGINTTTPVTKLDVSGAIRIGVDSSACSASLAGALRYNGGAVEYCNGTSWAALGVSGAGLTLLNGSASNTQTFSIGTAGNSPAFNTTNGVHTLNIPLASVGTTTAGLISNSDYQAFTNKLSATSAAVAATLGYTPANTVSVTTLSSTVTSLSASTAASFTAMNSAMATSFSAITSSQWTNNASGIHYNSGNVGIGDSTPTYKLSVVTPNSLQTQLAQFLYLDNDAGATRPRLQILGAPNKISLQTTYNSGGADLVFGTNTVNNALIVKENGSIGIGVPSPQSGFSLDVSGQTVTRGSAYVNGSVIEFGNGAYKLNHSGNSYIAGGNLGVGTSAPTKTLDVSGSTYISGNLRLGAGTASQAPFKFTSGTLLASPQSGTMEYDGNGYYLTDGAGVRRMIATGSSAGTIDNASVINSTGNISMVPVGSVIVSSTTASTNSSTGALVVNGGLGVSGAINANGNIATNGSLTVSSDITANNLKSYVLTRALPGAVDDYVELAKFSYNNRAFNFRITITVETAGVAITKTYLLPSRYQPTQTWYTVLPIAQSIWGSDNVELDVLPGTGDPYLYLRLRRSAGSSAANATVKIDQEGYVNTNYVAMTGTGSTSAPTSFYESTALTQYNGKVGIGNANPSRVLDVLQGDTTTELASFINSNSTSSTTDGAMVRIHNTSPNANKSIFRLGKRNSTDTGFFYGDYRLTNTGDIEFATGTSSANLIVPEMVLTNSGNLGIGTGVSAPASRLHIVDNNATMITLERQNNQNSVIEYKNASGSVFAGEIINSSDWGIGTGNDLGSAGVFRVANTGRVYIGSSTAPTARLHITPGTSSVAPIKLGIGTLLTSPQSGSIEYDGTDFFITDNNNVRRAIATANGGTLNNTSVISSTAGIALWPAAGNSVTVSSTVASTNSSTGALVVNGGLGVAGAANIGGALNVTGIISGSATMKATGYRANQGIPDAADSSTVGYAFGADGDTGMFSPIVGGGSANGILSFYSNNAEKMRLTNVGLGIGTTSPGVPLDVMTTGSLTQRLYLVSNAANDDANLILARARGTSTTPTAVQSGDALGGIYFRGHDGTNISSSSAYIAVSAEENFTGGTKGTSMKFGTTVSQTGSYQESMRIHSNGFVGIGSTAPYALLQVGPTGSASQNYNIFLGSYNNSTGQGQYVGNWKSSVYWGLGPATATNDNTLRLGNSIDRNGTWAGTQNLNLVMGGALAVGSATVGTYALQAVKNFNGISNQTAAFIGGTDASTGNTGIYVDSKDNVGLSSNNTQLLNVIHNDNTKFVVTGAGNVGVNALAPNHKFDVQDTNTDVHINVQNNSSTGARYPGVLVQNYNGGFGGAPSFSGISYRGNIGSPAPVQNGDTLANFSGLGATNTSYGTATGAYITMNAAETFSPNALGTNMYFATTPIGSSNTQTRMTITNGGNVGIGTTSPVTNLQIRGGASYGALMLGADGGTSNHHLTHELDGSFGIFTGTFGSGVRQLTITSGGAMGIGVTNPTAKLDVAGGQIRSEAAAVDVNLARIPSSSEIVLETAGDGSTSAWLWREKWPSGNYGLFHDNTNDNVIFVGSNSPRLSVGLSSGNIGVGTSSPQARLHVAGDVRIVDGNQSAGRVLASDANGTGAWKQTIIHGTINSVGNTSNGGQVGSGVSITLPPGKWQITGMGITTPTSCRADFGIRNQATTAVVKYTLMPVPSGDYSTATVTGYVDIAATTTYDLYITSRGACASQIHVDNNLWEITATGVAY